MSEQRAPYGVPKPDAADEAQAIARAFVGGIPVVGAAASELLNFVVTPSLERRRDEWMEEVAEGLRKLESKGAIEFDELSMNEAFVSTVLHATQAALRTTQKEKLDALRNAALNSAQTESVDEAEQQMIISFLDSFNEWHLRLLSFFGDTDRFDEAVLSVEERFRANGVGVHDRVIQLWEIVAVEFPDLSDRTPFMRLIIQELYSRGLLAEGSLPVKEGKVDILGVRRLWRRFGYEYLSETGRAVLKMIREPF